MPSRSLLRLVRTITTLTPKRMPLHAPAPQSPPRDYVYFMNRALDDLIKSGDVGSALNMFDEMPARNGVTYNLLISGQGRHGFAEAALSLYSTMVSQGVEESAQTFSTVLSICTNGGFYREGTQVHCRVVLLGFSSNLYIGSALAGLYLHMGLADVALVIIRELPERSLATWNLILRGFCDVGRPDLLFGLFGEMKVDGFEPNGLSFCYMINGCATEKLVDEGKQLHCQVIKAGWAESQIFVANSLVDFYSSCWCLNDAKQLFISVPVEDVISWNSIVSVYVGHGLLLDALELFSRMQFWGQRPSVRSIVGFLNLSSETRNIDLGKQIHCLVKKLGFDQGSFYAQSALIDMYGKCGEIEYSISAFESLTEKCMGCCNSLMTSLLQCGMVEDVVELFGFMVGEGFGFDEVSLSTMLKAISMSACGSLTNTDLVCGCAIKSGYESDTAVSCTLIDAYSRWGCIDLSHEVFEKMVSPNVTCFTSIISAYARNGMGREGLEMLDAMTKRGLKPDEVTFLAALLGCSHSGLVEEGRFLFYNMTFHHGINPNRKHYSCMIDLLGRAGLLSEAEELLKQAPEEADCAMWSSLLRSCRVHGNEMVGRRAAEKLIEFELGDPAVTLQVSNFYCEIGEYQNSMQIREIAMGKKMTRQIGHSLIEAKTRSQH
ncbi:hypothetical protein ACJRO7_031402 [Eucalyptus globulus]|uniref:Pentatricopeptide repeat-containing protein n=1 Tax=Eucalyptus globulus TaxID=34317 RepID=A0ABD3JGG2_EUCGL